MRPSIDSVKGIGYSARYSGRYSDHDDNISQIAAHFRATSA